jgi:uncharacterized cupredoxin-like copper-binding protein
MSDRPRLRLLSLARMGLIATSLVGSMAIGGGSLVALAQDASPAASPSGTCAPGTMSTGMATPTDMATPTAEPTGSEADEATTAAAQAFVDNAKACASDEQALASLVTPNLVKQLGGYDSIDAALKDGFFSDAPFGNATTGTVTSYDDGSVGIEVMYMQTEYQAVQEEWILVQENGEWKLNNIHPESAQVDGDSAAVGMTLTENGDGTYSIVPNAPSVVATDAIIFQAINPDTNKEHHMLAVFQVPDGMTAADVAAGKVKEEDTTFIGGVFDVAPGSSQDLTLVNLPAGKYVIACFIPGPDGTPHAMNGMVLDFEVTAPEGGTPTS